jgi:hypothetical protein
MLTPLVCRCGERLRANPGPGGAAVTCPTCGAVVDSPAAPTKSDPAAESAPPILVRIKRRRKDPNATVPSVWVSLEDGSFTAPAYPAAAGKAAPAGSAEAAPEPRARRRLRRRWQLEEHWYESLAYPARAWPLVLGLGAGLALLTGLAARLLPALAGADADAARAPVLGVLAAAAGLLLVYTAGFLDCVLTDAVVGEYRQFSRPGYDLGLRRAAVWLAFFLAGPALPAGAAAWYYLSLGDVTALDRVILAELVGAAVAYWVLALLAATDADRLLAGNPRQVAALLRRLGPAAAPPLLLLPALLFAHGWFSLAAAEEVHRSFLGAMVLLTPAWVGTLYLGAGAQAREGSASRQSLCFWRSRALSRSISWTRSNSLSQSWSVAAVSPSSGGVIPVGQAAPSRRAASAR